MMRNSIRIRTFCYFAFSMLIVILAFSTLFFRYFYTVFQDRLETDQVYAATRTSESVGSLMDNIKQNAYYLCSSDTLADVLVNKTGVNAIRQRDGISTAFSMGTGTPNAPLMKSANAVLLLDPQFWLAQNITKNFDIRDLTRAKIYSALDVVEEEWYQETVNRMGEIYAFWHPDVASNIFFSQMLRNTRIADPRFNANMGVVLYSLPSVKLHNILATAQITKGTIVLLAYEDMFLMATENVPKDIGALRDELLSLPRDGRLTEITLNKEAYTVSSVLFQGDWRIIVLMPEADVADYIHRNSYQLITIIIMLFLIVSALISVLLSKQLMRPILQLSDTMGQMRDIRHLPPHVPEPATHDEIATLYRSYNTMLTCIQTLTDQAVEEAKKLRNSELKAMQAQINPHFIYNTLDSVTCSALLEGNEDIVTMATSLVSILKYSVHFDRVIVPLREEIDYLRHYVRIQELRYKNGFHFICDVPEKYYDIRVSQIILQPLVENSLFHAHCEEGSLEIRLYCEGIRRTLLIHVADNGVGGDAAALNRVLRCTEEADSYGIGIRNVNKRIKLLFGEESGLRYEQLPGGGLDAIITVPLEFMDEQHQEG